MLQAEKYLKDCTSKITDKIFQNEIEQEYNQRKFNQWHKWKQQKYEPNIEMPDIDIMTINIIKSIVQTYPEMAEKYMDFFVSLNISFDENVQKTELSLVDAEKFIVSFKLQRYLKSLQNEKIQLLSNILENAGEDYRNKLKEIDENIIKANEKLELLLDVNK
mgnify:CR=1 FL=1